MREFILRARKGPTSDRFDIRNRCGPNRLDVLCSCVVNAISMSLTLRKDTIMHVILEGAPVPPVLVSFESSKLVNIPPHEEGIAQALQQALKVVKGMRMGDMVSPLPGITVTKQSFEGLVKEKLKHKAVYYLHPQGEDIRSAQNIEDAVFILGDYIGIPEKSESLLDRLGAKRISVGPQMLYASHCVVLVHNELDRRAIR